MMQLYISGLGPEKEHAEEDEELTSTQKPETSTYALPETTSTTASPTASPTASLTNGPIHISTIIPANISTNIPTNISSITIDKNDTHISLVIDPSIIDPSVVTDEELRKYLLENVLSTGSQLTSNSAIVTLLASIFFFAVFQ